MGTQNVSVVNKWPLFRCTVKLCCNEFTWDRPRRYSFNLWRLMHWSEHFGLEIPALFLRYYRSFVKTFIVYKLTTGPKNNCRLSDVTRFANVSKIFIFFWIHLNFFSFINVLTSRYAGNTSCRQTVGRSWHPVWIRNTVIRDSFIKKKWIRLGSILAYNCIY